MDDRLTALKRRLGELADLGHALALANWDQQTMMPPRGAQARSESIATLTRISHELFVGAETGRLIDGAERELRDADPDSDDSRLVQLVRRRWEKARRVPPELASDLARAASIAQEAWVGARERSDFASFAPYLETNLKLARRYVECHLGQPEFECAYDVLLDDYEPRMPTAQLARLFAQLRDQLVSMLGALPRDGAVDEWPLHARFAVEGQRRLVREVVSMMGFDDSSWRLDDTVHPFATRIGVGDVRITTRWDEDYFPMALYGAMHECGHGLYEAGLPAALARLPTGAPESLGMHESQSRLWENMVGRSRAFCEVLAPRIAALAGGRLASLDAEALYRAVNAVRPGFIRVEADEVTYGLHVILRFELEQELIEGRLTVAELPEAWNARVREYLGLEVADDADGVLQDVHWSAGLIGYFPTYALGNLIAGQLWERACDELPGLEDLIAAGDLAPLREWLRERVHRHGAKFTTGELLERELGAPIQVGPFADYLRAKLASVYGPPAGRSF
ncbi:MAG TPA: carboxypeptidase M32 [Solirubrobacteraceae bacterium]|nr:carboxypeptidase M32 [Solirubrobacteraceae bacterium]